MASSRWLLAAGLDFSGINIGFTIEILKIFLSKTNALIKAKFKPGTKTKLILRPSIDCIWQISKLMLHKKEYLGLMLF